MRNVLILLSCVAFAVACQATIATAAPGTYTYYTYPSADRPGCTLVSVYMKVQSLNTQSLGNALFFPAMQVNFGPWQPDGQDGAHVGVQRVNSIVQTNWGGYFREFTTSNYRYTPFFNNGPSVSNENQISSPPLIYNPDPGVSVAVGHFDPGTYTQANQTPSSIFNWQVGVQYKYVVYRGGQKNGYWTWHCWVDNISQGGSYYIGAVYTKESYIDSFLVWVETSIQGNTQFDVRWTNPRYVTSGTLKTPTVYTASTSADPYDSVVAPTDLNASNVRELWHRNGILVPSNSWKAVGYGDDNTW